MNHDSKAPALGRAHRNLACLLILSLVGCLALAIFASPASATSLYSNLPSYEFGPDGTDNFSNENSFYGNTIHSIAIDPQRHRLYVLHYKDPGNQGRVFPGVVHGLYGFDISNPSEPKPLGGEFPLAIPQEQYGYSWLAVDPNDGSIYMIEKAEECFCEPGGTLYSWDPEGKPRPGYPTHIAKSGPFTVDPSGYLWVWRANFSFAENENVGKFLPDGTPSANWTPNPKTAGASRGGSPSTASRATSGSSSRARTSTTPPTATTRTTNRRSRSAAPRKWASPSTAQTASSTTPMPATARTPSRSSTNRGAWRRTSSVSAGWANTEAPRLPSDATGIARPKCRKRECGRWRSTKRQATCMSRTTPASWNSPKKAKSSAGASGSSRRPEAPTPTRASRPTWGRPTRP